MEDTSPAGPLSGLLVLDLSRILAGPTCTQLLGDLGADVIKVERLGRGDDTRAWGPPFLENEESDLPPQSAYYLSSNRNKRSLALDVSKPGGQDVIRRLAAKADILIENYKVGDLARRGLGYDDLSTLNARLVYCSISGFGQTGPYAKRPGYDFLIQGMGGIMSITGEPDGRSLKTGVGIADVMCGMYATVGILAALRHRDATGEGQHIDLALVDTQMAWLIN
ncbi:MAG: CaiB/BaiF CoA-transferase family protein, partial [Pseudomonadota bacterium]